MADKIPQKAARLAIKALLHIEWHRNGGGTLTCVGCGSWTFNATHSNPSCLIDKALKAAGYPDQPSRDAARREIDVERDKEWRSSGGFES